MVLKKKVKRKVSDLPKQVLPPRRKPTLAEQVQILARQATCALSGEPIGSYKKIEWDHSTERAIGGKDSIDNWQAVLKVPHRKKTSGTKATSAGSSVHKAAKVKQLVSKMLDHGDAMRAKVSIGNKSEAAFRERMAAAGKPIVPRRGI